MHLIICTCPRMVASDASHWHRFTTQLTSIMIVHLTDRKRYSNKQQNIEKKSPDEKEHKSTAYVGVYVVRRVLRNPPVRESSLVRPIIRVLHFPRPHDPPAPLFIRNHLRFPELSQERLVTRTERRCLPREPSTAPYNLSVGRCLSTTVLESTISIGCGPLSNCDPVSIFR
jgi:hypothetical protein